MKLPLRGITTPLATPLQLRPFSLDISGLERLIEHVIKGGVNGIFLLGTTGEFSSLGREMRQEVIRRATTQIKGRVPVLIGITDTAISETLLLAETAELAGADALVLAAPYYFQHSQDDLLRYVEQIAERVTLPLFLYNIPHLTKTSFDPETVRRAADLPGVVGLKDSTGDLKYLDKTISLMNDRPGFTILVGPEQMLYECMQRGANGGVCGGSNLNPALFVGLYNAIVSGDSKRAEFLQAQVEESSRALYHIGYPGSSYLRGLKAALSFAGICGPDPAPPFTPFSSDEYKLVEKGYLGLNG